MANISDTYGTIEFPIDFARKYKEVIKRWLDNISCGDYGICNGDTSNLEETGEISFSGAGRWSWHGTIGYEWMYNDRNDSRELLNLLYENEIVIHYDYTDYECGFCFICKATADVSFKDGEIKIIADTFEDVDYTDSNKVEYGFEDGYSVEDMSDDNIQEYLNKWNIDVTVEEFRKAIIEDEECDGYVLVWKLDDNYYSSLF